MTDKIIYALEVPAERDTRYFATRDEAQNYNKNALQGKGSVHAVLVENYEVKEEAALAKLPPLDRFLLAEMINRVQRTRELHFEDDRGSPMDTLNR